MSGATNRRVSAVSGRGARVEKVSAAASTRGAARGEDASAWLAAWTSALDDLELDVTQAESMLSIAAPTTTPAGIARDARFGPTSRVLPAPRTDTVEISGSEPAALAPAAEVPEIDPTPWTPPEIPGPLPDELKERAVALLDRQLAAADALAKAMLGNRQHSGLIEKMERSGDEPKSAYVDRAC